MIKTCALWLTPSAKVNLYRFKLLEKNIQMKKHIIESILSFIRIY
jgi:hypothetical protein